MIEFEPKTESLSTSLSTKNILTWKCILKPEIREEISRIGMQEFRLIERV
jgi:hypothetical protein